MNQTLHIFRKDTRHFWPEILISLILIALYVAHSPSGWTVYSDIARQHILEQISGLLGFLTPLSWLLLIARVTYAESLIGDNEFWLTRPYERGSLLAAKVLFLAVWTCLPFVIAQASILVIAGFPPASYLPLFFGDLCFVGAVLLLPLFAIAAVNTSFTRMTLTLLSIFLLFLAFMSLVTSSAATIQVVYRIGLDSHQEAFYIAFIFFCASATAIALQYKTRRVWISRSVLMMTPILVLAAAYAYHRPSQIDRAYSHPPTGSTPPLLVSLTADPDHPIKGHRSNGGSYMELRVQYSGVPEGYLVRPDAIKYTLVAADGQQWTSPWQERADRVLPGVRTATLYLPLPNDVYERFQSTPITLHVSFAITRLKADTTTVMKYPSGETSVPGVGICSRGSSPGITLVCRSVNWQPRLTHITTLWSKSPCSESSVANENSSPADVWSEFYAGSPEASISPVVSRYLNFNLAGFHTQAPAADHLCLGAPLTITQYQILDRTQADFVFPNFQIPAVEPKAERNEVHPDME
jgi:ABC-type transport system involved in multi-copper enzyme maturation permease subunit